MKKLTLFILTFLLLLKVNAQPCTKVEELNRKRHKVEGSTYGHPYTTFDRHNGLNFQQTIINVRQRILIEKQEDDKEKQPVYTAYKLVYEYAESTKPNDDGIGPKTGGKYTGFSSLAVWAKCNAFVFLIGLNVNGHRIDSLDSLNLLSNPSYYTLRKKYRDNALDALKHDLKGDANNITLNELQHLDRSLILWLQTYDMLKAACELPDLTSKGIHPYAFGNSDANLYDCSPRNKLRRLTRELYINSKGYFGIVEHATGWKKNHGIAAASTLLMAAQVLNDAGVETDFFNTWYSYIPVIGWAIRTIAEPWPHPNYSPINWNKLGAEGIRENLFEGKHAPFFNDVPVASHKSWPNDYSVYNEGPAYALYGLVDCGIPAMRAQQNFYPNWTDEPQLKRNEIKNIFNWLDAITIDNTNLPSYDNSKLNNHMMGLALANNKYNYGKVEYIESRLLPDYIAFIGGNNLSTNTTKKPDVTSIPDAGNFIIRSENDSNQYCFQVLAESGIALAKSSYNITINGNNIIEGSHEDDDVGSFMIYAAKKNFLPVPLIVDPPYFGWGEENKTNKYWMHNTIEINDDISSFEKSYHFTDYKPVEKFSPTLEFKNYSLNIGLSYHNKINFYANCINRNFNVIEAKNNVYYLINDNVNLSNNNSVTHIVMNINGNGNKNVINTFKNENNLITWRYPCEDESYNVGRKFSIVTHVGALNNNNILKQYAIDEYTNGSDNYLSSNANGIANNIITRLKVVQPVNKTIFQTVLIPLHCNEELPTVTKQETEHFITTTIRFINGLDTSITTQFYPGPNPNPNTSVNDTSSHFHYVRFNGMEADTVYNPYNLPAHTGKMLTLNAQKAFLRYQTWAESKNGYKFCPPSYLNLHHASISNGSYLQYNDTFIIKSTIPINADIAFAGRYNYIANINPVGTPGATDSVFLYLPDVAAGIDMVAKDYLTAAIAPCNYDSFTRTLAIAMPTENTNFVIEEREKCQNCYFPPTALGIDTLFIINDGRKHTLSHKLTVKQGNGNLHLTNGSKIDMCTEVYLQNKDTIILQGNCQQKPLYAPVCQGIDTALAYNNNSAIIIGNGSALVLDSGSYTHVKSGGAIYVKQNGSLVIKNHAFVQIGDSGTCGWGEIIAEPGAFVHVEPMAHIEFRRTIADTVDRNYFVIATERTGNGTAFSGVFYLIDTILKLDTLLPIHYTSTDICSLDSINPIKNKAFGYANFAAPLATFTTRNDTLCPREPLHIKLNRILNDAQVQIKVCRMDSILVVDDGSGFTQWKDTCIADSIPINLIQPDPVCTPPRIMPDEWTYYFKPNTLNRVTISVINDCGKIHDTVAYIFATDTPKISIHVPDSACEGFGGFAVTASNRTQLPVKYAYEVSEYFNDTQSLLIGTLNPSEVYSFSDVGIVPDSFIFNNYYFKGGRSYIISLSVQNECNSFDIYDTIHIRSGAAILLSKPNVYAEPINGPKSVKLTAIIKQVDSLNWHPALWLNRTDTAIVISTPNDSIGYILTAYTGACLSRDTAIIKYNRVANAGLNDTLCFTNDTALLGNSYDMSIFLGWLYYLGGNEFRDMFMHYTSNQIDYFRYFTHFMMHEEKLQQWASFCPAEIVKTYNNQINRRVIFNLPWFKNYYASFTAFNDANIDAFDYFKTQIETDAGLMANLSGYVNWPVVQDCVNEMFYFYDDFLNNHLQEISSTWIKVSQNDTTVLTAWDEYFVAIDNPQQTSIYIQTVITPQYAEIDEVTVYRDTVLVPYFYAAMQFDSTVYFANATLPFSEATTFTWNFGDGSPISNLDYPIHTFAAFDTSYVVCMTANNKCGSFMYCDTIRIDSSSLSNQRVVYNNSRPGFSKQADIALNSDKQVVNVLNRPEIFLTNYPNPFGDKTIIDYQIWQSFSNASLIITNTLGQVVYDQKLIKPIDKVSVDGNLFSNGLYYYSIVIDNSVKLTKMMSVIH